MYRGGIRLARLAAGNATRRDVVIARKIPGQTDAGNGFIRAARLFETYTTYRIIPINTVVIGESHHKHNEETIVLDGNYGDYRVRP